MAHTDNVVGFWDLDSDSNDDSGNGNNGTDTSMSYDGTYGVFSGSGYITLPSNMLSSHVGTWSWWGFITSGGSGYFCGVNMGNGSGNSTFGILPTNSEQRFYISYPNGYLTGAGAYPAYTTLYHVVATNDGSTTKIYVNGTIGTNGTDALPDYNASIGKAFGGFANMLGSIRCVALYSVAKDQTWVTADYNSGTPQKWADWNAGGGAAMAAGQYYSLHAMTGR